MSVRKDKVQLSLEINGKQAGGSLKELQNSAKALKLQLLETTDPKKAAEYAASLRKVNGRMKDIWDRTRSVKKETSLWKKTLATLSVAGLVAGLVQGIRYLYSFGAETFKLYNEQAQADAQLKAAIKSTNEAAGKSYRDLKEEAAAFQQQSLYGDEVIQKAQATLLTFTKIQDDVFTDSTQAVLDYSARLGTDLQSAAIQVGKALNDPIKGISALGRAGVQFTDEQKEMITTLQNTGDIVGAQTIVLKELETQFGGSAKAAADAGLGGFTQLKNDIGDAKEELGEFLTKGLKAMLPLLRTGLAIVIAFAKGLAAIPKFLYDNRVAIGLVITGLILFNSQMILASANSLRLAAVEKGRAIATAAVTTAQTLLNAVMTANPIGLVIKAVGLLVIGFGILYSKSQKVRAGVAGLGAVANEVFSIIKESVQAFIDGWNKLKDGDIRGALSSFGTGISKALPINMIRNEGARLGKAFSDGFNDKIKSEADKEIQDLLDKENKLNTPASGSSIPINGGATGDTSTSTGTAAPPEVKAAEVVAEKTRTTYRKLYEDIATMAAARAEQRVSDIETQGDLELEALERNFLLGLATEEEHNALMLEQKLKNGETELAVLRELGLAETDIYREKELEKLRTQKEIDDQAIEQAKRTADLKTMLQQEGLSAFRNVVDSSIGLLAKDEAARKKNAGIIKAFETAKILVNAKVEISEIFKKYAGLPFGQLIAVAQSIAVGFRAASAISAIKSQSFYTGGRVLPSYSGQRISGPSNIPTQRGGDSVLATLMPGEVVLNPEQQMRAGGAGFFRSIGVPGFNTGGMVLTGADTTPISRIGGVGGTGSSAGDNQVLGDLSQMIGQLASVLQKPISAQVGYGNIEQVASDIQRTRNRAGL